MADNVMKITAENICCSCGICKAVCPKKCISLNLQHGSLVPAVDESQCVHCGLCLKMCPGKGYDYIAAYQTSEEKGIVDMYAGAYRKAIVAQTKQDIILKAATSGGFVSALVGRLLSSGDYDSAFLVDTYNYSEPVYSKRYTNESDLSSTPKSRYLQICHSHAIEYLLSHKRERIVFVGTPCFFHGLLNVIAQYQLDRDNYLLIGLFCDKTMTLHVWDYFQQHPQCGKPLSGLYFRTKDAGGWPGGIRLLYPGGNYTDLQNTERMAVKDYFMPERCLYCLDKLNQFADFSIGDNYTGENNSSGGTNSVIIRSQCAEDIWEREKELFYSFPSSMEKVANSQHLDERQKNTIFITLKRSEALVSGFDSPKVTRQMRKEYSARLKKINIGYNKDYAKITANRKRANRLLSKIKRRCRSILLKMK